MSISLGEHSKLTVHPSEREKIRKFYRDVLECPVTKESEAVDIFQIGNNFYLGVVYDDSALNMENCLKAIWLELRTDHPEKLKQKILRFGIGELEYWDKEHFYFQAPGGQVFRLADSAEGMSKRQK
ncbi:MAG: VOC family protein [Bacteroidota bacterium]|nr:VOC family protein [Bacteroidota bacterium]